jgi:hypothetical protein
MHTQSSILFTWVHYTNTANIEIFNDGTISKEQAKRLDVLNLLLEGKLKTMQGIDQSILELCELPNYAAVRKERITTRSNLTQASVNLGQT